MQLIVSLNTYFVFSTYSHIVKSRIILTECNKKVSLINNT